MKREILFAVSTFAVLFIVSFIFSILLEMGKAESLHDPMSLWMYARRGLMIIFGLVIPWLRGKDNLTAFGWKAESKWIFITIGAGVLIGLGNKGGFDPASLIAIILALFHTFATELFFRRYLLKTFSDSFRSFWPPIIISSFLYGLFYLTVSTTWGLPLAGKLFLSFYSPASAFSFLQLQKIRQFSGAVADALFGVLSYRMLF